MKTIRIILLAVVFFISKSNYGQSKLFSIIQFDPNIEIIEMGIDSTFYSSGLVCSITDGPVSGLSVTADIKLYSYEGYIRILLCDLDHEQDYLVYEAFYPLNSLDSLYHIEDYAYESNMLYNHSNVILRVEIHNGECYFSRLSYYNTPYALEKDQFEKEKRQLKRLQDSVFLSSLNQQIKEKDFLWIAGATSISELYYDQRKDMLPKNTENEIPNLQGLEYYKGGVFEVLTDSIQNRTTYTSNYVDEFDWRNRHGENWLTPSKTQGCNHCWAFCPISVAESSVNLHFNQHINYDLSEQHVASCNGQNQGNCLGGEITYSLSFLINQGVVLETCFPYLYGDFQTVPCSFCNNPSETISFDSYGIVHNVVDSIKKAVIVNGPICGGIESLWHYMSIVGFKTLKAGDTLFYNQGYNSYETIQPNDPRIGQTCWLFKNSKGVGWGDNGCAYFLPQLDDLYGLYKLIAPESLVYDDSDIVCEDRDGDGYYNWGIGPKPATCPDCPDDPDCDDSDPTLGPYDAQYGCTSFCDSGYINTPLYINESTTWNTPKQINRDIEILNGATLNICNTTIWELSSDCSIIIHPGGRLVLDSATITNPCGIFWQGIEVWGNYYTHQFPTNGNYGQGYLEMKNGATIENAVCAVELWRPDHSNTTGGIIHATDATFRNNATSVRALLYTNHHPSTNEEMDYNSFFENCNFVIDEDYLGTEDFSRHVTLDNVKGIVFQGCDFSVDREVAGVESSCMGIYANDAGFFVNALCTSTALMPCPEEYLKESTFTSFCNGIRAVSISNNPRSFIVKNTVFTDNDRGIYAANTGFPSIHLNEFNIRRENDHCTTNYGIYLDHVTGFSIEENTFQPVSGTGGSTIGIAVCNSNGVNDIYRNDFSGLSQANLALGQNASSNTNLKVLPGLTYTCNTFSGNQQDIVVLQEEGVGNIQTVQGSTAVPAGNTFNNSVSQIYNDGTRQINYYYNSNNSDETPNTSLVYRVTLNGSANSNPCHSHYGNGPVTKSASEKAALASDYLSAYTAYQDLNQLYESRIDGGSTSVQLANINSASSSDMWQLRAQLLGLSPYVSGGVLIAAADRDDVFTDPVLFEILAANPDELKCDSLISYMENKAHPLPEYMVGLLRQIASGSTARTALVAQMDRYWHDYSLAAGDIVRSNLNDTVANPTELRQWLGNMNDIAADRMVIASYLQEGDSVSAFTLANMLPDLYGLQGDQLSDHADYIRLIQLYQTLNRTHRTMYELTATEMNMVNDIAEEGVGVSRLMAKSLQEMVSGEITEICLDPEIPESMNESKGWATIDQSSMDNAMGFMVSVSPNPATTWAVVDYTLPSKMSKASVVITNTLGVTVMSTELNGDQGQKVLDLRDLSDGVYFVRVTDGEKHSKIVKLVKQK